MKHHFHTIDFQYWPLTLLLLILSCHLIFGDWEWPVRGQALCHELADK